MPRRSGVTGLPPEIRDELNARLVANGFSGYEALSEWLEEQGYSLSKSALHRHGSVLERGRTKESDLPRIEEGLEQHS